MARYKLIDTSPRFLAVDLQAQLLPGTFEHALNYLIDHEVDLRGFDAKFKTDATGGSAYPPACCSKWCCWPTLGAPLPAAPLNVPAPSSSLHSAQRQHPAPPLHHHRWLHLGPGAGDRSRVPAGAAHLRPPGPDRARDVRHRHAIDSVKLPGNSSECCNGARLDSLHEARKMEAVVAGQTVLARPPRSRSARGVARLGAEGGPAHRAAPARCAGDPQVAGRSPRAPKGLTRQTAQEQPDRQRLGQDATSKDVIQGYTGVAAVDDKPFSRGCVKTWLPSNFGGPSAPGEVEDIDPEATWRVVVSLNTLNTTRTEFSHGLGRIWSVTICENGHQVSRLPPRRAGAGAGQ